MMFDNIHHVRCACIESQPEAGVLSGVPRVSTAAGGKGLYSTLGRGGGSSTVLLLYVGKVAGVRIYIYFLDSIYCTYERNAYIL